MTARQLLEQLNALDEHNQIEAKTASQLSKNVMETVCAFANEPGLGGGWLLLGVQLAPGTLWPTYEVVGVPKPDRVSTDLASQCASVFNQPIRVEIEPESVNGKTVLKVFVPELPPAQKPLYFKAAGLPRGAFRRQGSSDVHCTDDDLLVFYHDRKGETIDGSVVSGADMTAIAPDALQEYRQMRAEANPQAEELKWNDEELLLALGCASKEGGVIHPTVAGILLFGTSMALRRFFPMMRVDYIRVPGREWVSDPERRFDTVEIRTPLIQAIRRARNAILDDLPKAFSLPAGQIQRQDIPLVPDRVIREVVVNALMHRSYRVHGAVQIIRYANRLEIRNPGHSLVAEDRLGEPGSETRNPLIAAVLHDTNLAETKGSGIRVMRELMDAGNLTPPTFESDRTRNVFVVTLFFHHFLSPDDWIWLRKLDVDLSDEEARALVFVREAGAINNAAYRNLNSEDVLNASTHLRRLRDNGLLEQKGKGAETYYVPTAKFLAPLQPLGVGAPAAQPIQPPAQSIQPAPQSANLGPQSANLPAQSGKLAELSARFPGLPPELAERIAALPARAEQTILENLVVRLCAWQPLATDDLAALLYRNRKYVLDRLVTPMLKTGRLAMTIPDQPNHPQQKYRAAERTEAQA
jgi:ATP-dependent DNA helicase RecG